MEMTAKEMFEELGYEEANRLSRTWGSIRAFVKTIRDKGYCQDKFICFKDKTNFCLQAPCVVPFEPTDDEKKAITQQMKELGWIE